MTALGDARATVAAALAGFTVPVFDKAPGAIQMPCLVILPGNPWIVPRGTVNLDVAVYVNPAATTVNALTRLEELIEQVRDALWAAGLAPGITNPPIPDRDSGSLVARVPTTLRTTCH